MRIPDRNNLICAFVRSADSLGVFVGHVVLRFEDLRFLATLGIGAADISVAMLVEGLRFLVDWSNLREFKRWSSAELK